VTEGYEGLTRESISGGSCIHPILICMADAVLRAPPWCAEASELLRRRAGHKEGPFSMRVVSRGQQCRHANELIRRPHNI